MPQFKVLAKEVVYYVATVRAESLEAAKLFATNNDHIDFVEVDSSAMQVYDAQTIEGANHA